MKRKTGGGERLTSWTLIFHHLLLDAFPQLPLAQDFHFQLGCQRNGEWVHVRICVYIVERGIKKKANPPLLLWLFLFLTSFVLLFFQIFSPNLSSPSRQFKYSLSFSLFLSIALIYLLFFTVTCRTQTSLWLRAILSQRRECQLALPLG